MNILVCPYFIFYFKKSVNYYLNYVQLNEVTQHKVDYYSGDDFLKVFKEKNLPRFSNFKMI